jgi:heterodisulfide reductase subunit C
MSEDKKNKFGFTKIKGRQINYEANDRSVAEYIFKREPSFRLCIECGGCAATCTTGHFIRFSLRELNILIKRGENDQVGRSIRKCMLCGKCSLVCPRGVNTRNVVLLAREAFHINNGYEV